VVECEFVEKSLFYNWFLMHSKKSTAARERRQNFSLKFNYLTAKLQFLNAQHNFCSLMRYIVLIWILMILTLASNILSHPFNWHKPVYCIPSDKIYLYQVEIRIQRMQILNSFVTSLVVDGTVRTVLLHVRSKYVSSLPLCASWGSVSTCCNITTVCFALWRTSSTHIKNYLLCLRVQRV